MKKTLILAAPLLMLAACAAPGGADTRVAAAAPAAGTQFCKKDRLASEGDSLSCNWSPTFADACENTNLSTVKKSAVAGGPSNAGRCGNGQWLVSVTTR